MKGLFYRLGISLKEKGERENKGWMIRLGLSIRYWICK